MQQNKDQDSLKEYFSVWKQNKITQMLFIALNKEIEELKKEMESQCLKGNQPDFDRIKELAVEIKLIERLAKMDHNFRL